MGISNFSIFSKFLAKDGVSPVFSAMTKSSDKFGGRMNSAVSKAKTSLMSLKSTLTVVGAALTAVATAVPVKSFADWQKGINNVYGLMSKDEIGKYGKKVEQLSKGAIRLGISTEDANKAVFDTISAMGVSEKSFEAYNQAIVLAKAGNTDLATSVKGITSVMNAWGIENTNATTAANAMFTAQKYGVTTVQELADNIGKIAPTARAAGVSMEETSATLAALTKGGLSTDNAATALQATMAAFIKPSKEASEVLKKYGIASDLVELKQQGLGTTFSKLIKLQKEHPAEIAKAVPKIKALTGVLSMNEDRMKDVDKILNQIKVDLRDGSGLKEAFDRMMTGDAQTLDSAMGALNIAMIAVGKLISPVVMPLVKGFGEIVFWLSEMAPKLEPVVAWFIRFGGGLKDAFLWLKNLEWMLPIVTGLLSGIAVYKAVQFFQMLRVQAALFGMVLKSQMIPQIVASIPVLWAQTAALLANPLFWIPALIVAVITGLVLLWKHWDKVVDYLKFVGEFWKEVFDNITAFLGGWVLKAVGVFTGLWTKIKETISNLWRKIKSIFGTIGNFIKEHFVNIILMALGPIGMIINAIRNMPKILKALHLTSDAIEIKTKDDKKNPKKTPKVEGTKNNGTINVKTTIDNNTGYQATTSTSLQGTSSLNLKPAQ